MTAQQPSVATPNSTLFTTDNATRLESQSTSSAASASELASTKISLKAALRQFPDFPISGIDFVDILPLFASHSLHTSLLRALELQVLSSFNGIRPDVIVGLDARGFLFGPSLALQLGAGFAPVRKRGKLPGPTKEASFEKEYGQDFFQIQGDAVKKGQTVLVVDDIIATGKMSSYNTFLVPPSFGRLMLTGTTGGSAAAAGQLVEQLGGNLIGYLFILELDFLKGRDRLNAPVFTLLSDDVMGK
jgi:adenine phosphoribosyltransferase